MNRYDFASGFVKVKPGEEDQRPEDIPLSNYYILEGRKVVPCEMMVWAKFFESKDLRRSVGVSHIGNAKICTSFMGINMLGSMAGPPDLFETMIFGGDFDGDAWRCSTYAEAEEQHEKAIKIVKGENNAG